jgi:predicted nucleic acid-binding protein
MLRGAVRVRQLSEDSASLAYADLLTLRVELFGYYPLARRIWELRGNVTAYDAWYVALAEALDSPLATLDARLARAPGPQCQFLLFED